MVLADRRMEGPGPRDRVCWTGRSGGVHTQPSVGFSSQLSCPGASHVPSRELRGTGSLCSQRDLGL